MDERVYKERFFFSLVCISSGIAQSQQNQAMETQSITFVLLLTISAALAVGPCGVPSPTECASAGQFYPNTCDCSQLYVCLPDGSVDVLQCTDGLVYDPSTNNCVLKDRASPGVCGSEHPCGKPSLEDCKNGGGFFPNTCDCTHFYQCLPDGHVDELVCSDDFVFVPNAAVCVALGNAPPGTCGGEKECGKPTAEDCETGIFFENTCNSSKFFQCLPGGGVLENQCSDGLVFDEKTATCILPN